MITTNEPKPINPIVAKRMEEYLLTRNVSKRDVLEYQSAFLAGVLAGIEVAQKVYRG